MPLSHRVLILFGMLCVACPAPADDQPVPAWEPLGLVGTEVHTLRYLLGDLFVGAVDGLHIMNLPERTWRSLDRGGAAGWPVTAIGRAPFYPDHVITGRVDSTGHGALANTSLADGATVLKLVDQPAPFTRIDDTGYFANYRVWACAPAGSANGVVLRSGSGGEVWTELTGHGFSSPVTFASTITVVDHEIVPYTFLGGEAGVQSTVDNGATFSPDFDGLPAAAVNDICVGQICIASLPKGQDTCDWYFVATEAGLFFRAEEDSAWVRGLAAPCQKVLFESYLYLRRTLVLTNDGRLLSCDMTQGRDWAADEWIWEDWGSDLGASAITDFCLIGVTRIVATAAQGIFSKKWPDPASDVPDLRSGGNRLTLSAAPNPFNPTTSLGFTASRAGHALLTVHDLRGRRVATLLDHGISAGPMTVTWQPRDQASGIYLARLELLGETASRRIALVR